MEHDTPEKKLIKTLPFSPFKERKLEELGYSDSDLSTDPILEINDQERIWKFYDNNPETAEKVLQLIEVRPLTGIFYSEIISLIGDRDLLNKIINQVSTREVDTELQSIARGNVVQNFFSGLIEERRKRGGFQAKLSIPLIISPPTVFIMNKLSLLDWETYVRDEINDLVLKTVEQLFNIYNENENKLSLDPEIGVEFIYWTLQIAVPPNFNVDNQCIGHVVVYSWEFKKFLLTKFDPNGPGWPRNSKNDNMMAYEGFMIYFDQLTKELEKKFGKIATENQKKVHSIEAQNAVNYFGDCAYYDIFLGLAWSSKMFSFIKHLLPGFVATFEDQTSHPEERKIVLKKQVTVENTQLISGKIIRLIFLIIVKIVNDLGIGYSLNTELINSSDVLYEYVKYKPDDRREWMYETYKLKLNNSILKKQINDSKILITEFNKLKESIKLKTSFLSTPETIEEDLASFIVDKHSLDTVGGINIDEDVKNFKNEPKIINLKHVTIRKREKKKTKKTESKGKLTISYIFDLNNL